MKFVLLVEGETEQEAATPFIKRSLDVRLKTDRIGVKSVLLRGSAKFAKEVVGVARRIIDDPGNNDLIAVIGLLDLYGQAFYPSKLDSADDRYQWAKQHFEGLVQRELFHMFFAVHEVEAWLLSQPAIFPTDIRDAVEKKSKLPERVNFQSPPSKVLASIYNRQFSRSYHKKIDGAALFRHLDPDLAARTCPRLNQLLETMCELARSRLTKASNSQRPKGAGR